MHDGTLAPVATERFSQKREAIIAAATEILNRRGVKGTTLADVADRVGLITTSVTYYFRKKEALAAACFISGIERLSALVAEARRASAPSERVHRLLELYLQLKARIAERREPPIPIFSDVLALAPEYLTPIGEAYADLYRRIRALLKGPGTDWLDRRAATARTQILLEQLHWSEAWLHRYDVEDYPRVCERMHDILVRGLGAAGAKWRPAPLSLGADTPDRARDTFLLAATRLINQRGYRGASVEKIAASLNVTKGSFYHHHHAKDDVVSACFDRSFEIVRRAQAAARALEGDEWLQLTSAAAALVEFQLSSAGPLLRSSALAALPEPIRIEMVEQSWRLSDRFAAMISDGIAGGSLRPVDPFIVAQMLNAALNAAADLPYILRGLKAADAVELYARPMFTGLLSP